MDILFFFSGVVLATVLTGQILVAIFGAFMRVWKP